MYSTSMCMQVTGRGACSKLGTKIYTHHAVKKSPGRPPQLGTPCGALLLRRCCGWRRLLFGLMFRRFRRFFEHARHLVTGGPIAVFQQLFGFVVHGLQIQLCVSSSSLAISLRLPSSFTVFCLRHLFHHGVACFISNLRQMPIALHQADTSRKDTPRTEPRKIRTIAMYVRKCDRLYCST